MTMSSCFLKMWEFWGCGEFRDKAELVSLDKSTSDINSHLSRCHLGHKAISEGDLILARLGLFCMPEMQKRDMFICAKHHAHLGQYWSKPNTCKRPQGRTQGSQNRSHIHFWKVFGVLVPIGVCKYHWFSSCFRYWQLFSTLHVSVSLINTLFFPAICSSCRKAHSKNVEGNWQ